MITQGVEYIDGNFEHFFDDATNSTFVGVLIQFEGADGPIVQTDEGQLSPISELPSHQHDSYRKGQLPYVPSTVLADLQGQPLANLAQHWNFWGFTNLALFHNQLAYAVGSTIYSADTLYVRPETLDFGISLSFPMMKI